MKNTSIFLLFFITLTTFAQKPEVSAGIPVFNNVYLNFEKPIPKFKNISFTSSIAHKFKADGDIRFDEIFFGYNINSKSIKRTKFDIGFRAYLLNFDKQSWLNMYVGTSLLVGKMSREFNDFGLNISKDSLQQKAIYFGPEFTAGLKIVILKKITITPAIGMAYFFKSDNSNKISKNPALWYSRDWLELDVINKDNTDARRKDYINLGFAWQPNIYINFGYKF